MVIILIGFGLIGDWDSGLEEALSFKLRQEDLNGFSGRNLFLGNPGTLGLPFYAFTGLIGLSGQFFRD